MRFGRDDKVEDGGLPWRLWKWMDRVSTTATNQPGFVCPRSLQSIQQVSPSVRRLIWTALTLSRPLRQARGRLLGVCVIAGANRPGCLLFYPKADLRDLAKAIVGATPGFPVQLGGSGALRAAFLSESRIRGRVQCSVQEIRDTPSFFGPGTLCRTRGTRLFYGSAMTQTPSGLTSGPAGSRPDARAQTNE